MKETVDFSKSEQRKPSIKKKDPRSTDLGLIYEMVGNRRYVTNGLPYSDLSRLLNVFFDKMANLIESCDRLDSTT